MTTREPEWTDDDRAWLLALIEEEHQECPGCGHPYAETTDQKNRYGWRVQKATCQACEVLEAQADNDNEAGRKYGAKYMVIRAR